MSATANFIGVAFIAWTTLAFQIVLTRLFSAVLPYHFTFLAVSLAMLGTGAGALVVYMRPGWRRGEIGPISLSILSALFAISLLLVTPVLSRLNFGFNESGASFFLQLSAAATIAALPPVLSGVLIALAIRRYLSEIGRLYAFDLAGASLGALLVVPLLNSVDAPLLLVGLAGVAALSGFLFSGGNTTARRFSVGAILCCGLALVLAHQTSLFRLPHGYTLPKNAMTIAMEWNAMARVFGFTLPGNERFAAVFYDRVYAPVPIVKGDTLPDWRALGTGPQSIGYELIDPGRVLIIGGGVDEISIQRSIPVNPASTSSS